MDWAQADILQWISVGYEWILIKLKCFRRGKTEAKNESVRLDFGGNRTKVSGSDPGFFKNCLFTKLVAVVIDNEQQNMVISVVWCELLQLLTYR